MAPSRGLFSHLKSYASLFQRVGNPANKHQIYVSRSPDPYFNLSFEHCLLQKSPAESTILFLYTNRPSVILGRNQNPWVEVNLPLLETDPLGVELVRRRSGGGTVFHDEGNVNYSVICPTAVFNRDKHAEMVVQALKKLKIDRARVNERHDIVVDRSVGGDSSTQKMTPFKISGSAYKLTRLRSLHHGTCLLMSPNLGRIGQFLKSPVKASITARGVESVSSQITNANITRTLFEEAVIHEFQKLYGTSTTPTSFDEELMDSLEASDTSSDLRKGYSELKSLDWTYGQTPQFTYSSPAADFTARNGIITEFKKNGPRDANDENKLVGEKLYGNTVDPDLEKLLRTPYTDVNIM